MVLVTDGNTQYYIEGSMVQNTQRSNILTSYPTVEGTAFTDHYYREPDSVTFTIHSSEVSKSLVHSVSVLESGERVEADIGLQDLKTLVEGWFTGGTRVKVTSKWFTFPNQVLKSYSWSDSDLATFNPQLVFQEGRVQSMRTATIVNPDEYYQAAYGSEVAVGGMSPVQTEANLSSPFSAALGGMVVGGLISLIPGVNVAFGTAALIGGALGFFGSLFGF